MLLLFLVWPFNHLQLPEETVFKFWLETWTVRVEKDNGRDIFLTDYYVIRAQLISY